MSNRWKWAAASARGTGHAALGEGRQDAYRVLTAGSGFMIAVTCDGAGSTSHGRYGAAIACRRLSMQAKQWAYDFDTMPAALTVASWITDAREGVAFAASSNGLICADFAATVVLAISDGSSTITAHIGDGAVVARQADTGDWIDLSWPHHGEYAATTHFLTEAEPCLRIGVVDGIAIDRLALFTDGLERLALDFGKRCVHAPFFDTMLRPVGASHADGRDDRLSRQLGHFLDTAGVNARTDDDKTLILAALG